MITTTGADLARGPGHLRYPVLPGQPGVSALMARRGMFGACLDGRPADGSGQLFEDPRDQRTSDYVNGRFG